jgi:ferredoxin
MKRTFLILIAIFAVATAGAQSFAELKTQAEQGDAQAMYELSKRYNGIDDYKNGFLWLEKAANANNPEACIELSKLYDTGFKQAGIVPNADKAIKYFIKATEITNAPDLQVIGCFIDDNCVACGACIDECPVGAISAGDGGIYVIDHSLCTGCGACVDACPVEAIICKKAVSTSDTKVCPSKASDKNDVAPTSCPSKTQSSCTKVCPLKSANAQLQSLSGTTWNDINAKWRFEFDGENIKIYNGKNLSIGTYSFDSQTQKGVINEGYKTSWKFEIIGKADGIWRMAVINFMSNKDLILTCKDAPF